MVELEILYEDNHLIAVNKASSEIVQGDKTGDVPLTDKVKQYIKEKYKKPGEVFLGLVHRLDRPVTGVLVFARTSKSLSRMNEMFRDARVEKTYWAIVKRVPEKESDTLTNHLVKNEKQNKSYIVKPCAESKEARLQYRLIAKGDNYSLLEVKLITGRHHQIRCQLASIGSHVKGDLKYGAERSNPDGSISLHARSVSFIHPVSKEQIKITAPVPNDPLWQYFEKQLAE